MSDLGGHISPAVRGHSSLLDFRRTRGRRLLFVDRRRSLHVDSKPRRRGDFMSTIGKKAAKDTMILCVMGIRALNDSPIFWGPQSTGSTTPNNGSPLRPRYACCGAPPRGHTRDSLKHGTLRCERRNTDLSFRTVQGVGEPTLTPAGRPISFCIHPHELLDVIRHRGGLWPSTVLTMQSEGIIASVCAPPPPFCGHFRGILSSVPRFSTSCIWCEDSRDSHFSAETIENYDAHKNEIGPWNDGDRWPGETSRQLSCS